LLTVNAVLIEYALVVAFAVVGVIVWVSYSVSKWATRQRVRGSAIAILLALALAYAGGVITDGKHGIADIGFLAGVGLLGGTALRDLAIVATAFGVRVDEFRSTGLRGILSLAIGLAVAFLSGALVAYAFGYRDAVSLATIGGGAATYIVGPVTGTALGASSEVIALSVATGLVKSILVMTLTPFIAPWIGLDNPRSALIFGGVLGTTSGGGGRAAPDERLVPYGAMSATFYTGLGCLVGPSLVYLSLKPPSGA
jgi:malonate transporter MadM subunit